MPIKQQVFAILVCLAIFFFTFEMVRWKKLREEYSVLWLLTSLCMFVLVLQYDWLVALTRAIGAVLPTTTLFLGSVIFLTLIAVQFSIKISQLADQVKNLTQENALLAHEVRALRERDKSMTDDR
jgi:hypothetical protein